MPYIESLDEFKDRMGCEFIKVKTAESFRTGADVLLYLFSNGGVSNGSQHIEPPNDARSLLARRRDYLRALLDREQKDFSTYRARVLQQAAWHASHPGHCPPAPPNAPTVLRESQARIEGWRSELAQLDEQLTDPATRARQVHQEQTRTKQQGAAALLLQDIKAVTI